MDKEFEHDEVMMSKLEYRGDRWEKIDKSQRNFALPNASLRGEV
jgi:hypothetical protein